MRLARVVFAVLLGATIVTSSVRCSGSSVGRSAATRDPGELHAAALHTIDKLMNDEIRAGDLPGGSFAVVRSDGSFLVRKAYGDRTFEPRRTPADLGTIYELASLTKPVATASAVMLLVQRGQLRLVDRVAKYLPAFAANGKQEVNVAQLLTHTAGMQQDYPPSDYTSDRAMILKHAYATPLRFQPGTRFEYSDLGYIVLGELVAHIAREPFERFVGDQIFTPLHMTDSSFDTTFDTSKAARVAPQTIRQTDAKLRSAFGTIPHVNGHAGMLSTVDDLARFAVAELRALGDHPDSNAPLAPATVRAMIAPRYAGGGALRGLGWDLDTVYSGNRGDLMPRGGFGHTGSSGTSMWIDPALDIAVIFVSNAHYPIDKGTTLPLEGKLANVIAASLPDVDREAVREQERSFNAAAARSALGFPTPGPPPTPTPHAPPRGRR